MKKMNIIPNLSVRVFSTKWDGFLSIIQTNMPKIVRRQKELKEKKPRFGTIPKMSISIRSNWIFIALFIVAYGILYFIIKDKLPFTPDFSSSDAFHLNVSLKYKLWQSIREGVLPFWTDKLAGGFPLIAESQIGAFFLPNLLILPLFSVFAHGYMLLFVIHLFLLSVGMFLLLKELKVPHFLSFLLAITFTWSGAISFRWVHFNFLQVFSLTPILFLAYFKWNHIQKWRYVGILSFILCEMIFAGHMQTTFNVLLGLLVLHICINYPLHFKKNVYFILSILFGFLLAAPQIVPTLLLSRYSYRSVINAYQYVVQYIFNTKDLIGFYSSKALGIPQNATYGGLIESGNRIYWENTPYLGELFIILLLLASIYYWVRCRKQSLVGIYFLLSSFFLLLAFGGDSPLYFIFGIFPFNMFRTPPKFLLITIFFLILFAGIILKEVISKHKVIRVFIYISLVINGFILITTALNYHVFIDSQKLFNSINTFSKTMLHSNYITFGGNEAWNKEFKKNGWNNKMGVDTYLFLNSAMFPNSNLIIGNSAFDVNTGGLTLRRNEYIKSTILNSLSKFTEIQDKPQSGIKFENFLALYNIGTITSFKPLYLQKYKPTQTRKNNKISFTVFQNKNMKSNPFYIPETVNQISYLEEVEDEISREKVSENYSFAESLPYLIHQNSNGANIQIRVNNDQYLKSIINTQKRTFMVVKKSWYPEWHLFIDGKESGIYKTNLIHMGFYISKGKHTLELVYIPTSFYIGCGISILSILSVILIIISRRKITPF